MATVTSKIKTRNKCWQGYGEMRTTEWEWFKCKIVQPLWKNSTVTLQKLKHRMTSNFTTEYIPRKIKSGDTKTYLNMPAHSTLSTTAKR